MRRTIKYRKEHNRTSGSVVLAAVWPEMQLLDGSATSQINKDYTNKLYKKKPCLWLTIT